MFSPLNIPAPRPAAPAAGFFRASRVIGALFVFVFCARGAGALPPALEVRQFFIAPGQEKVLRIPADKPSGSTTRFDITDYQGKSVSTGNATVEQDSWQVPVNLSAGYYDLSFPDLQQGFGLTAIAPYEGTPDPFFCIDTGLSWLAPKSLVESYILLLKRCGMAMSRERLSWPSIHPADGETWDWDADHPFDRARQLYHEAGIPILELAHGAPARFKTRPDMIWPDRVAGAVDDWKAITKHWSPVWGAIESWNEPDVDDVPVDQYVAWNKALYYAVHADGGNTPVGGGVFAYLNRPYLDLAAKNGLLDTSNFISFHFYGAPAGLEAEVADFRRWLQDSKRPEMPLWITEAGSFWEGPPATRAPAALIRTSAMKIIGNAVEAKACGIARFFAFVYVNYSEGTHNYGMLDLNGTPTRSMAAYAAAAQVLKNASYVGDLPLADAGLKRARVFSADGNDAVVVLYTDAVDPHRTVSLPFAARQVIGIDGRILKVDSPQTAPVPDGLSYVLVPSAAIKGLLKTDTGTAALASFGRVQSVASANPSPIILKPMLADAPLVGSKRGYSVPEGTKKLALAVFMANCDSKSHEVQLTYSDATEQGGELTKTSGTVPAAGDSSLSAEIEMSNLHQDAAGAYQVRVDAHSPGIERIEPITVALLPARGLDEYLKQYAYRFVIPLGEAHRWSSNIAAMGSMSFEHGPEAQWGFTTKFTGGEHWVFPKYALPQEVNLDRVQGILIRARCMQAGTVRTLVWTGAGAMAMTPYAVVPSDGDWHVNFLSLDGFLKDGGGMWGAKNAAGLTTISVGINSQADQNHLEVSDLYLVGK